MSQCRKNIGATAGQSRRRRHRAALLLLAILAPACGESGPAVPGAPGALAAAYGDALVALGWTASPGATSYRVKRSTTTGGPYATIATQVTTTAYTNTGLTNGTPYFYVVSAENAIGEGSNSPQATATPVSPSAIPAVPAGLAATGGDNQVALSWTAAAGASTYQVQRSLVGGGPYANLGAPTANTFFTDATAANGVPYFYVVSATNINGTSANSAQASATPAAPPSAPAAPTGLAATAGDHTVNLTWNTSTGASTYQVKRGITTGGLYVNLGAPTANPFFTDSTALNGVPYFYVVTATNSVGTSPNSSEATATPAAPPAAPPAPTNLVASAGNAHVDLSWNAVATASSYQVQRALVSGGPYADLGAPTANTFFTDGTAANGTPYFYVVKAINTTGTSVISNQATATPVAPPAAPTIPAGLAAASGNAQIVLTWTAATGTAPLTYNIKRGTVTTGPYTQIATGIVPVTYTDTTAVNGTTYFYVVAAQNPGGSSANSAEASATPLAPPTTLAAVGVTGQVNLTWVASTGAIGYNVKRSLTTGGPYVTVAGGAGVVGIAFSDTSTTNGVQYFYVVTAVKTTSESAISNQATATPLAAPTGVGATASAGQVALNWTAVTGAASYTVQRATVTGGPYSNAGTGVLVTNFTDTGRTNGTTYFYVIIAVNASGQSSISGEVFGTPLAGPTGLTALAGTGQVTLSWTGVTGATSYNVKRGTISGGPYVTVGSPATTGLVDGTLTNGTTYFYVVTAVTGASESAISNQASGTPIAAPTTLAATSSGSNTVGLTWVAGTGATSYTVMRGTASTGPYGTTFVLGNVTAYSDTTATNGTTYFYVVVGVNATGFSSNSNEAAGTPLAAPTGIIATPGNAQVAFTWTAVTGANGYNVKRSGTLGGPYSTVGSPATNSFTNNTGLVNGTTYYYVISATNSTTVNEGPNSVEVPATPVGPPAAPTGLTGTAGNTAIALTWTAPAGTILSYNVLIGTATGVYGAPGPFTGITTTFTTIGSLTNATPYFFVVQAVGPGGTSVISSEFTSTPTAGVPVAPTLLTAVAGNAQISLTWSAVGGATGYNVKRSTTSGSGYASLAAGTNIPGTGLIDATAVNGTTYYYVVTALNGAPESLNSNQLSATPLPPPGAPTGLAATVDASNHVVLSWNVTATATSYNVKRSTSTGTEVTISNPGTNGYTDLAVSNGTKYFYVVSALNAIGEGANSAEVTATPLDVPSGVAASGTTGLVSLSWVSVTGATGYRVLRSTTTGTGYAQVGTPAASPFNDSSGLANGTTYFYVVEATATNSQSQNSSEVNATPLAAPTGAAANGGDNQVALSWNSVTGATGYNVKRSLVSGSGYVTLAAGTGIAGTSLTDLTAVNGTPYFYVITAIKGGNNESSNSSQVTSTPAAGPDVSFSPTSIDNPVTVDRNLVLTFTTSMNKASVESRISINSGAIAFVPFWDVAGVNGTILTLVFDTKAPFGTITGDDLLPDNTVITCSIASGAQNAALTQSMGAKTSGAGFTTALDTTPPQLVSITPDPTTAVLNGPATTSFVIVFNEPMTTSAGSGAVQIQSDLDTRSASVGSPGAGISVAWGPSTTLTVTLSGGLNAGTGYRMQLQSSNDAAGNGMAPGTQPKWNVITFGAAEAVRPTIAAIYPPAGASGVSRDSQIFISLKEMMHPHLASKISITPNTTPFVVQYEVGKDNGPLGCQLVPLKAWPASTLMTVTIDKSAADASVSANTLSATTNFTSTFTTAAGNTNAISINDPFSTFKNGMVDVDPSNNGINGSMVFKDTGGTKVFLDASPTGMSLVDLSITDPAGIPIKGYGLATGRNEDPSCSLNFSRSHAGTTSLSNSTVYTVTFKNSIKSSTGGAFTQAVYTFTTAASLANRRPMFSDWPDSSFNQTPGKTLDLQIRVQDDDVPPTLAVSVADDVDVAFVKSLTSGGGGFSYSSPGTETLLPTNGNHTITYTMTDGNGPTHTSTVKDFGYFFTSADLGALTPAAVPAGLTPTYSWSGAVPASCDALVLALNDNTTGQQQLWVVPKTAINFAHPTDHPLITGHSYTFSMGLFHSLDGALRGNGTFGSSTVTQTFTH